jgi:hypothetical protein
LIQTILQSPARGGISNACPVVLAIGQC